jgi:hypothetical protein
VKKEKTLKIFFPGEEEGTGKELVAFLEKRAIPFVFRREDESVEEDTAVLVFDGLQRYRGKMSESGEAVIPIEVAIQVFDLREEGKEKEALELMLRFLEWAKAMDGLPRHPEIV